METFYISSSLCHRVSATNAKFKDVRTGNVTQSAAQLLRCSNDFGDVRPQRRLRLMRVNRHSRKQQRNEAASSSSSVGGFFSELVKKK